MRKQEVIRKITRQLSEQERPTGGTKQVVEKEQHESDESWAMPTQLADTVARWNAQVAALADEVAGFYSALLKSRAI